MQQSDLGVGMGGGNCNSPDMSGNEARTRRSSFADSLDYLALQNGALKPVRGRRSSLDNVKLKMRSSMKCMFPFRKHKRKISLPAMLPYHDDAYDSDQETSTSSLASSEGDDMSICYPLDPVDAGIFRKPAVYGGRRSAETDPNVTESTECAAPRSSSRPSTSIMRHCTRLMSMEKHTMDFASYLQSPDIQNLEQHLMKLGPTSSMHVVNQRLDAEVDAQIDCALPYKCFTALGYAVLQNDPELVELLLRHDADTSAKPCVLNCNGNSFVGDPETPLHLAALFGCNPRILLDLIEYSGSLREESIGVQTDLLKYTATCTDQATVARILGEISDVSMVCTEMDTTALHLAVDNSNLVAVEELLKHKAFVNCKDRTYKTPLMIACYHKVHGHCGIVEALLKSHADVEMRDMFDRTVLHYAIRHAKVDCVKLLIDAGADIRARDCRGQTILSYIFARVSKGFFRNKPREVAGKLLSLLIDASQGNLQVMHHPDFVNAVSALLETSTVEEDIIIKVLESNKHHIKSRDCSHSQRVLHLAVKQQQLKTLEWFLEYGLNVQLQDADGWKAIHYAIATGSCQLVDLLLRYGANINDETTNGITPIWLMVRYCLTDMAQHYIKKGGCRVAASVKLKYIYHVACESPRLPKELFDPDQQKASPIKQAKKAQRTITLLDFSLHMGNYAVASLILDKVQSNSSNLLSMKFDSTQEIIKSKLELEISQDSETKEENIDLLEDMQEKLETNAMVGAEAADS